MSKLNRLKKEVGSLSLKDYEKLHQYYCIKNKIHFHPAKCAKEKGHEGECQFEILEDIFI